MENNYRCLNSDKVSRSLKKVSESHDSNKRNLKKRRLCLKCGNKFLSIGPHNRLCENCASTNSKLAMNTFCVTSKHLDEMKDHH